MDLLFLAVPSRPTGPGGCAACVPKTRGLGANDAEPNGNGACAGAVKRKRRSKIFGGPEHRAPTSIFT